jgi:hypothetical protein
MGSSGKIEPHYQTTNILKAQNYAPLPIIWQKVTVKVTTNYFPAQIAA